jgi:acyl-CoA thioester hydrolase
MGDPARAARALLDGYPVVVEIPVAWGEMDAFGHVNNVVYFRWFESARIAFFEAVGYLALMASTGVGPILASADCRFRIPLAFPDRVHVGARVNERGEGEFLMGYATASERHGRIAAEGTGRIVSYDYRQQCKAPLQAELVERLDGIGAGR